MSEEAPYHAPIHSYSGLQITPVCPCCGADLEEEALVEGEDGLWRATEGGFRACEGCGTLLELPAVDLRMIAHKAPLAGGCDTVYSGPPSPGGKDRSGVTEHGG